MSQGLSGNNLVIGNITVAIGQQGSSQSIPVVIAADQGPINVQSLTGLQVVNAADGTPLYAVLNGGNIDAINQPVNVQQATGTNLHAVIDSGTVSVSGTPNVSVSGTAAANITQISGATPSPTNALQVVISDGNLPSALSTLLAQKNTIATMQLQATLAQMGQGAGFIPMEVPSFLGA